MTNNYPSLFEQLKTETHPAHEEVEKWGYGKEIQEDTLTLAQYQQLLWINYDWHSYYEPILDSIFSSNFQIKIQYSSRKKLSLLKQEIQLRNWDLPPLSSPKPKTFSFFEGLGILYVMEGSTLGGVYIHKKLSNHLEISQFPILFYGCYGKKTAQKWRTLKEAIEAEVSSKKEQNLVIKGAKEAFETIKILFQESRSKSRKEF